MTVVLQSYLTQKKVFDPLRLHVWTSPLTLSSVSSLLFLLPRKYSVIRLRLTWRLLHFYKLLTTLQLQSQIPLCLPRLYKNSQFRCLKPINLKLQTNFLHLIHTYRTFDPFFHAPITSNFSLIFLLLDVKMAVNTIPITHGEQNDAVSINIYNTVSNQNSSKEKIFWDSRRRE